MSDDKKNESKPCCASCGSTAVVLTEEKNATPRCGGCGKPVQKR